MNELLFVSLAFMV